MGGKGVFCGINLDVFRVSMATKGKDEKEKRMESYTEERIVRKRCFQIAIVLTALCILAAVLLMAGVISWSVYSIVTILIVMMIIPLVYVDTYCHKVIRSDKEYERLNYEAYELYRLLSLPDDILNTKLKGVSCDFGNMSIHLPVPVVLDKEAIETLRKVVSGLLIQKREEIDLSYENITEAPFSYRLLRKIFVR